MMGEIKNLHVVFFPAMAHGHMIPTLDIARLFVARNVETTIITTPVNAPTFTKYIEKDQNENGFPKINIELFKFPAEEVGLPNGCENLEQAMGPNMTGKFFQAMELLREQLEEYLEKTRPNCLVADMFFPWATDSASKFNIPRLTFHGINFFSLCAIEIVRVHEPYKNVSSDEELFTLPYLPHEIKMTRLQFDEDLWKNEDKDSESKRRARRIRESEIKSYGAIVNSFHELEPEYAQFYKNEIGRRAWSIGPVSLCNRSIEDKTKRGKQTCIDEHECLEWLNSKEPNSVIYICFGSTFNQAIPQLCEIAKALESSNQNFIWVVRNNHNGGNGENEEWLPAGFEERTKGKGMIIRGWAPQVLILEHEAIGAFCTHCGWNSTLEGISAGVPMITWPVFAEQFFNEKLVNQILKVGVPIGAKRWSRVPSIEDMVKQDAIEKALIDIMVGEEAMHRRSRAKTLKDMAMKAIEKDGSSYSNLTSLIEELKGYDHNCKQN